jgi:outer membrane lipoprotein-sorting protein
MPNSSALPQGQAEEVRLPAILNKALRYCRRLEKASLDFVCLEEISEKIDYSREREDEIVVPLTTGIRTQIKIAKRKQENTYLYDFQFTRKGEFKRENRNLLEKNGKKAKEQDAPLETSVFQVRNVLFGPLGLLSENMQGYHDYQFVGEEEVQGKKIAVIDATPKSSFAGSHGYGRIWVDEGDGSVLKIEWKPESLPDIENLKARAKKYQSDLSVTLITEYGFEKNGIHFPSRDTSEEAYLKPDGRKFIRSRTAVVYRDYKFFTVETDIKY